MPSLREFTGPIVQASPTPTEQAARSLLDLRLKQKANPRIRELGLTQDYVRAWTDRPLVDPQAVHNIAVSIWIVRAAIEKIAATATANGWDFEPKFAKKCLQCDFEMQNEPDDEACERCHGSELRDPDEYQLRSIKRLFEKPNHDRFGRVYYPFEQLLRDWVWYNQSIDDFFAEISYEFDGKTPKEIWPLPGEFMRHVDDMETFKGWYCHTCWPKTDATYAQEEAEDQRCPNIIDGEPCGRELEETEWVQLIEDGTGKILARMSAKRIIHGNSFAYGGRRWGLPKTLAVWYISQTLRWMEMRQWSSYSQNMSPDVALVFPGMSQEDVNKTATDVIEFKKRKPGKMVQLWLGAQEAPIAVRMNENLVEMQAIQMANFYREAVAIVYGVSMQMLGVQTPGKLGDETETIEVSYATVEEAQATLERVINTKLIPLFLVKAFGDGHMKEEVQDWNFVLKPPRQEDLSRRAQVIQGNLQIAQLLEQMGYPIKLDEQDYMMPEIDGKREKPQQPMMGGPGMGMPGMGGMGGGEAQSEMDFAQPDAVEQQLRGMDVGQSMTFGAEDFKSMRSKSVGVGGGRPFEGQGAILDVLLVFIDNMKNGLTETRRNRDLTSEEKSELMAVEQQIDDIRRSIQDARRGANRLGTLHDQGMAIVNPVQNILESIQNVVENLSNYEQEIPEETVAEQRGMDVRDREERKEGEEMDERPEAQETPVRYQENIDAPQPEPVETPEKDVIDTPKPSNETDKHQRERKKE